MDENQQQTILRAIAVSSLNIYPQELQNAFQILEELRNYPNRIPLCINWLHQERHSISIEANNVLDITIPTKLYVLEIIQQFLRQGHYNNCTEQERLTLRSAILTSARQLAPCENNNETKILANKLASILAGLVVRDFPQRWTTLTQDIFQPQRNGGLWYNEPGTYEAVNHIGVRICLECFKLVVEDCTDGDYNAKISTTRRNDILIGLNEVSSEFLPLFYQLLEHTTLLLQASEALHNMRTYLLNNHRTLHTMTQEESTQYQHQLTIETETSRLLSDTLITLEKCCRSMPLDWLIPSSDAATTNTTTSTNNSNSNGQKQQYDFMTAFLHLIHTPTNQIQVLAVQCLEFLILRGKFTSKQWFSLITELPNHILEANRIAQQVESERCIVLEAVSSASSPTIPTTSLFNQHNNNTCTVELMALITANRNDNNNNNNKNDINNNNNPLIRQIEFYKVLSRLLAQILSCYVAHITLNKNLFTNNKNNNKQNNNNDLENFSVFLQQVVDVLHHPSGKIASEQVNMWITLLRDPQISRSTLLQPFAAKILTCYMKHIVRIKWEDIDNQTHPQYHLIEASWDDEDEYDAWLGELRSKTSLLFRFFGTIDPQISSGVIQGRIQSVLRMYGNGEPRNNCDPITGQITPKSDAVIQFEGVFQPLDAVLSGIPSWAIVAEDRAEKNLQLQQQRNQIRQSTRESLSEVARSIVSWNPSYLWLKFRRATLLDALKHYWKHDPSTLLQGIESLLGYLSEPDYWNNNNNENGNNHNINNDPNNYKGKMSDETIGLKKKSGVTLIAVSKKVPHHLVPWLSQLSQATRELLSSSSSTMILAPTRMHLYEFLSCIATAVQDPEQRKLFIAEVLSDAVTTIEAPEIQESLLSVPAFLSSLGITAAGEFPESVRDPTNVKRVSSQYVRLFTALNQFLSVGKHCNEAARKRLLAGTTSLYYNNNNNGDNGSTDTNFPDEGPISIHDLGRNDPFAHIWPRILPTVLRVLDVTLRVWHPEHHAVLLQNSVQRYAYAISDDEAFSSKNLDGKSGGVFGEGGTAGSVVSGTDRRDQNLVPKWSGWFNELRNTSFQMLGLLAGSRVLYAPELIEYYPTLVAVVADPMNLKAMEHRHMILFIKHFVEILTISCPATMYPTHFGPILRPLIEHMQYRLEKTWLPVIGGHVGGAPAPEPKALFSATCSTAAVDAARGGDEWFNSYYARAGLFVGDLDSVTAETAVEKGRVDITRTFCDFIQSALALKGDWALVLANLAKEEQANRKNDSSKLNQGPKTRPNLNLGPMNADGTPRGENQVALDARKSLRIAKLCHFLLLEDERIAGSVTVTMIQCLGYPDQYTCRRVTRICHRILETVAWVTEYAHLLGHRMFLQVVKNIVQEPKWMVGIEWDAINVMRDIYGRLVLGQTLLPGGQGPGMQQVSGGNTMYEQAKTVDNPLQGGGILMTPSEHPRKILLQLPDVTVAMIEALEKSMKEKPSAKNQKDKIRDLLRKAADKLQESDQSGGGRLGGAAAGIFDRVVNEESLLHHPNRQVTVVPDIPEKLVTKSMVEKKANQEKDRQLQGQEQAAGLSIFQL